MFKKIRGTLATVITRLTDEVREAIGDRPTKFVRTTHPWLHPTKGWRQFARHGKANRRRKLVPQGQIYIYGEIRS
jgi:hypothetical protein